MALGNEINYMVKKMAHVNSCSATGGTFYADGLGRTFFWGGTAPVAADYPAPSAVWADTTNTQVKYNSGTMASPTWTAVGGGSALGLDAAFDIVKIIDGANSSGNALAVGDGTDALIIYTNASVPTIATNGTSDLVIAPDGGDTDVTGTLTVSGVTTSTGNLVVGANKVVVTAASGNTQIAGTGDVTGDFTVNTNKFTVTASSGNLDTAGTLTVDGASTLTGNVAAGGNLSVAGDLTAGTVAMDAVVAASATTTITVDGTTTGGVDIGSTSTGDITLGADTTVASGKAVVVTGVAGTDVLTLTDGDAVISDGSLTITDTDNATTVAVTNNTVTSNSVLSLTSTSLTTGNALSIVTDGITSGSMIYLDNDQAASFTGEYIRCFDGTTDDFVVALHGATTIAGTATGTDALTLTKGDITLVDGDLTLTTGDVTLAAGSIVLAPDAATDCFDISPAADGAVFDINLAASSNLAGGYIDIDGSTGSGPVLEAAFSGAYTGDCLSLNMTNAVGAKALDVTGAGTRTAALLHLTDTPGGAGAHTIDLDVTPAAGATSVVDIDVTGTDDCDIITVDFAGAYTGDAIAINLTNTATANGLVISGSNTPGAAVNSMGATGIPDANGRILELTSSGNASAANVGICARVLETGAAQATSYALQVDSTSNEALNVSTGKSHFAESVTMLESAKVKVAANYVQAGGANNAITVAANADDTGTDIPLTDGLRLIIDLNTKTLQAGANTLDYIGGGAVSITKSTDPAANIGTAYAANGVIELVYSSGATAWLCMAQ